MSINLGTNHTSFEGFLSYFAKLSICSFLQFSQSSYVSNASESVASANTGAFGSIMLIALQYCLCISDYIHFQSSFETKWERHLSITKEGGSVLYECYMYGAQYSLQHIADALHLCESILPPFVARMVLPRSCSFLLLMQKKCKSKASKL